MSDPSGRQLVIQAGVQLPDQTAGNCLCQRLHSHHWNYHLLKTFQISSFYYISAQASRTRLQPTLRNRQTRVLFITIAGVCAGTCPALARWRRPSRQCTKAKEKVCSLLFTKKKEMMTVCRKIYTLLLQPTQQNRTCSCKETPLSPLQCMYVSSQLATERHSQSGVGELRRFEYDMKLQNFVKNL